MTKTNAPFGERPVADWLDYWVTTIAPRRARPLCVEGYARKIKGRINPYIGHLVLGDLQPEDLENYLDELKAAGLSQTTRHHIYAVLARALKVAGQRGHVRPDLTSIVDRPRTQYSAAGQSLTKHEVRAVLREARRLPNAARWTVALALGLRQSEALALQWKDFDEQAGTLSVRRGVHWVTGIGEVYEEPKSPGSRRTVVLPRPLLEQLRQHRIQQSWEREAAAERWHDNDLIFADLEGKVLNRRVDYTHWRKLLASAGVRAVRLHDARHTAATLLLTEGVPLRVVMNLLGHTQVQATLGMYGHVLPASAREAAEVMSNAVLVDPDIESDAATTDDTRRPA